MQRVGKSVKPVWTVLYCSICVHRGQVLLSVRSENNSTLGQHKRERKTVDGHNLNLSKPSEPRKEAISATPRGLQSREKTSSAAAQSEVSSDTERRRVAACEKNTLLSLSLSFFLP